MCATITPGGGTFIQRATVVHRFIVGGVDDSLSSLAVYIVPLSMKDANQQGGNEAS